MFVCWKMFEKHAYAVGLILLGNLGNDARCIVVTLMSCTQEILSSNLGSETEYHI
jgi:hypothetical protein